MNMKIVKSEYCLCTCCMEKHEVQTVLLHENTTFKGVHVSYDAFYLYCDITDELYMNEHQMQKNDMALKNAYRKTEGLLTSDEISHIRSKYDISQGDLCTLLGWGQKTITRYEGHQVQDRAHDTILKKIDNDPEWFMSLLLESQQILPAKSFQKYLTTASALYEKDQDFYLRKSIEAEYVSYRNNALFHGNTSLSLDKVIDVIRYFAASDAVTNLYQMKLMRLLWYADALSYKARGNAITGLIYRALPTGATPIGQNSIINLKNIPCEEIDVGEANAYYFCLHGTCSFPSLQKEDTHFLDIVIKNLGKMSKNEIIKFIQKERAYTETASKDVISFAYAQDLQLQF